MLTNTEGEAKNGLSQSVPKLGATNNPSEHQQTVSALSEYQKISDLSPYKLGFKLCEKSFEVHILSLETNTPRILARIELSGAKNKTKTITAEQGCIIVKKPDRGRLEFSLVKGNIAVEYSALAQPGGIKVCILSKKTDAKGNRLLGASNQTIEILSFQRLPSEECNLKLLTEALSRKNHRKSGLMHADSILEFCSGMKDLYQNWSELKPRERILMIRLLSNKVLMNSGVYPCYFPEQYISDWQQYSPASLCRFNAQAWSIHRSGAFVDKSTLSKKDQIVFAEALYRELRSAEQTFLVLRYLAGSDPELLNSCNFTKELLNISKFAKRFPIDGEETVTTLGKQLLVSIASSLEGLAYSREEPKLKTWQQIFKKLGRPYLFHQIDCQKAGSLIRRLWDKD